MISEKLWTDEQYKNDLVLFSDWTTKEITSMMAAGVEAIYCPAVKGNCKGHGCTMFMIDRRRTDPRYIEALCTFAGTRTLMMIYAEPEDWNPEDV